VKTKTSKRIRPTAEEQIYKVLSTEFARKNITVYRYNSAAIRVRVVDARFHGKSIVERENMVFPLIQQLPEDIQSEITIFLPLSPKEAKTSLMNGEFEDSTPAAL
jgi:stress-induced morphogen